MTIDVDRLVADAMAAARPLVNRDPALCPATACSELCGPGTSRPCSCPPCQCPACGKRRRDARLLAQARLDAQAEPEALF